MTFINKEEKRNRPIKGRTLVFGMTGSGATQGVGCDSDHANRD